MNKEEKLKLALRSFWKKAHLVAIEKGSIRVPYLQSIEVVKKKMDYYNPKSRVIVKHLGYDHEFYFNIPDFHDGMLKFEANEESMNALYDKLENSNKEYRYVNQ